ncbi:hypothetical protein SPURM210S_04174 [Streptomyces purpurascens]
MSSPTRRTSSRARPPAGSASCTGFRPRGPADSPTAACRRVTDVIAAQDGLAARAGDRRADHLRRRSARLVPGRVRRAAPGRPGGRRLHRPLDQRSAGPPTAGGGQPVRPHPPARPHGRAVAGPAGLAGTPRHDHGLVRERLQPRTGVRGAAPPPQHRRLPHEQDRAAHRAFVARAPDGHGPLPGLSGRPAGRPRPSTARLRRYAPPPATWRAARCACRRGGTRWSSGASRRSPGR